MLSLTVKVGQVVVIGEGTAIKLLDRSGRSARLVIQSDASPIRVREDGTMPEPAPVRRAEPKPDPVASGHKVTYGVTGEIRPA